MDEFCSNVVLINLSVMWSFSKGNFLVIMQHTVVAVFPNADELGSSYSHIMVSCSSLIHFKDDIFF